MKNIHLTAILFLVIAAGTLEAQRFPSLEASPAAHDYARRITNRNTSWRDLAEAALWASSVNAGPGATEKAAAYMERIIAAAAEIAAADIPPDIKAQGEYTLEFLHRNFLKSYRAQQTRVDEIFSTGRYNCVSSAVLYMVLGLSLGLDVQGVMTMDHAFATVNTGTERIDVETTNRYGFDPGNRKEFLDAFGRTTGFAYVPARNYHDRVIISRAELVSLILSNRISVLEQANRFAEAVPLAVNRAVFLSGSSGNTEADQNKQQFFEDPRQDMMIRLFNLGAYFVKTGKEDDAIAWAQYANERYPDPRWQDMIKTSAHNKLVKLITARKISAAYSALAEVMPKLSGTHYAELETMVIDADATNRINTIKRPGDAETVLAFLAGVWEQLPSQRRYEMRTTAILTEAERLGKVRDWAGSISWLSGAMSQYGANSRLESAFQACRQNRINELHNEFANLYNRRNYAQAKASIERSLQEFPGEQQLLRDLNTVERVLQQ